MRIATWNLWDCPPPPWPRGQAIASWLNAQNVDIWLLTEVRQNWPTRNREPVISPNRADGPGYKRWASIDTALALGELRTVGDSRCPGEESLCLARLKHQGQTPSTVLIACSVLPWKDADKYWTTLPSGQARQFRRVLDHHVERITDERYDDEPLIWGGDFNQPLTGPLWGSTKEGRVALQEAMQTLEVVVLTADSPHLQPSGARAVDHLAVSPDLLADQPAAAAHCPIWDKKLSDHAAYTADIRCPTGRAAF